MRLSSSLFLVNLSNMRDAFLDGDDIMRLGEGYERGDDLVLLLAGEPGGVLMLSCEASDLVSGTSI